MQQGDLRIRAAQHKHGVLGHTQLPAIGIENGTHRRARRLKRRQKLRAQTVKAAKRLGPAPLADVIELALTSLRVLHDFPPGEDPGDPLAEAQDALHRLILLRVLHPQSQQLGGTEILRGPFAGEAVDLVMLRHLRHVGPAPIVDVRQAQKRPAVSIQQHEALPCTGRGNGVHLNVRVLPAQLPAALQQQRRPVLREKILSVLIGTVPVIDIGIRPQAQNPAVGIHQCHAAVAGA